LRALAFPSKAERNAGPASLQQIDGQDRRRGVNLATS